MKKNVASYNNLALYSKCIKFSDVIRGILWWCEFNMENYCHYFSSTASNFRGEKVTKTIHIFLMVVPFENIKYTVWHSAHNHKSMHNSFLFQHFFFEVKISKFNIECPLTSTTSKTALPNILKKPQITAFLPRKYRGSSAYTVFWDFGKTTM